jgi:hypothetical protein
MAPTASRITLYDDWRARREHLATLPYRTGDYHAVEMRVLDFLLERYRDSPEAARPARFSLKEDVYFDHRAIVVVHHLGGGHIPQIKTAGEAQAHVRSILQRMFPPGAGDAALGPAQEAGRRHIPLPAQGLEMLRMKLCDSDPVVRVLAAVELAGVGTLDDIGLLSDLLSLPTSADEHPRERAAQTYGMQRLAGITAEPFDLSGVVPPAPEPGVRDERSDDVVPAPAAATPEKPSARELPDWQCAKCGADVPGDFEVCWACGTSAEGLEDPTFHRLDEE